MVSGKTASTKHLIVALLVLTPIALLPVMLLEPRTNHDPILKAEELEMILSEFTPDAKRQILKHVNVRDDRLVLLPFERLDEMVLLLRDQAAVIAKEPAAKQEEKLDVLLEKLDRREPIPVQLQGVGIVEKVGTKLPLDLVFRDEAGQRKKLGSFFQTGKPIILTLNYSDCPQLCHIQLNNFVDIMQSNKIQPGKDFEVITVSINPDESPEKARYAKKNYLKELNASADSWHFLTTDNNDDIKKLAATVGYNYKYDPIKHDYAHSSTLIFCTPAGVVSQYYQGIVYEPKELLKRVADAREGALFFSANAEDNLLNCKIIDESRPYAAMSMQIMKVVATTLAVLLILTLTILWMLPNRRPVVLPPLQGENRL
ncbi:MAG TPA: SCO family protein [Gemmatales bacterium]|nr:SCO family protein [Gemmatales bacterium]